MSLPRRHIGSSRVITKTGLGAWAIGGGGWVFGWEPQDDADSLATTRHTLEVGVKTSAEVALVQCLCNLFHQFAFDIGLLKYSRFAEIL
jgi:hypothetical protein